MWRDLHDEIRFKGGRDPFQQRDGRDNAGRFQAGKGRLCHASAVGKLGLRQAQGDPPFTNCPTDEECPPGLRVTRAVLLTATAR